ncbi:hypothetical protein ZWY2020_036025 [Hordeum vulgare]|nr:hypothetical protein ZWY2020_036025 [Hordeum vulgare]
MSGSLASPAPEQAAAATSTAQPQPLHRNLLDGPHGITDEASGRVLPCIALREGAADPLAGFVDLTSGRVFPCVALMAMEESPVAAPAGSLGSPSYADVVASADSHSVPEAKMAGGNIPGAAHRKPATSTCSVVSTPEMEDEAYHYTRRRCSPPVGPCSGITTTWWPVAEHGQGSRWRHLPPRFPKDFLLVLWECHQCDLVFERRQLVVAGVKLLLRPWFPPPGGNRVWRFYCRVAIEGLPLNAWSWDNVQEVIGKKCRLDLIERQSTTKTNVPALFFGLWARPTDP